MNPGETEKAAIKLVQENLNTERFVEYGSLELQSGWARWRDDLLLTTSLLRRVYPQSRKGHQISDHRAGE